MANAMSEAAIWRMAHGAPQQANGQAMLDTRERRCLFPRFDGCVAQRESTVFTRRGSQVQSLSHPPSIAAFGLLIACRTRSDRFLQFLRDPERDLLAGLDLD